MQEFILSLILVSPIGITTHEVEYHGEQTLANCELHGEAQVGEYIPSSGRTKWFVTGYACDSDGVVEHTIYPLTYTEQE